MARMQILNVSEKAALDNPPIFDFRERKKFFEFPKPLLELANSLRNPVYQVCFLVSCGYFRVARRFFSPVDFLTQKRIQIPRARTLSGLIRSGLHERKAELIAMMDSNLTDETRCLLDDLFSSPDDQKHYRLTLLKKMSQSTKPSRIKECIADYKVLFILYKQLDSIFSVLDLGHAGIRYYAGSVIKIAHIPIAASF